MDFNAITTSVFAVIFIINNSLAQEYATPTLDTPVGKFVGKLKTSPHNGKEYVAYKGVPFATPPVGELRFTRPLAVKVKGPGEMVNSLSGKKGCLTATKTTTNKYYGEDCLYLNIYVPTDPNDVVVSAQRLPVMVWLHGGGFVAGGVFPEPIKLVTQGDVIVVMVNYRMGVFGFLTTMDASLPSNNGLWDQYLAVKWVSENIAHLNGDPTKITFFGESAGAMSVGLHALSPLSSKYFQKAILQSGSATSIMNRDALQRAGDFGKLVGCPQLPGGDGFASCLRNVSTTDILVHTKSSFYDISKARQQLDFIWTPVVDGEIIPREPMVMLQDPAYLARIGVFQKHFMIGLLNNEGSLVVTNFMNPIQITDITNKAFYSDLTKYLLHNRYDTMDPADVKQAQDKIESFYFKGVPKESLSQKVLDLVADATFVMPAIETALAVSGCSHNHIITNRAKRQNPACGVLTSLSKGKQAVLSCQNPSTSSPSSSPLGNARSGSRTYLYSFDYCPDRDSSDPNFIKCMGHGADYTYEFPKKNFTDATDQKISDLFINLLTTFAAKSDPGFGWPEFEPQSQQYLSIGVDSTVKQCLYGDRVNFWRDTFSDPQNDSGQGIAAGRRHYDVTAQLQLIILALIFSYFGDFLI